ncbi:MAG: tRNA uridine-5-carboxymethylaminomethyl(34) synthesis GTPase MnmE [Candidatus Omnitrophica bacterium]|nr:tRNA uridine-5-carboxymethylaminomethyl(34) synthesis GTPase MnmE [Candidatus Omnitrophota bacterium]
MYQYEGLKDTIAAISTPAGQGGIGIVRLSGPDALNIAQKMFRSRRSNKLTSFKSHTIHYGWIVSPDEKIIDEVLVSVMRAPKSYTTEDVVEISCHGGLISLQTILNLTHDYGARLAQPGEFTKRAFLNGRIDLTQAEAVLDIIQSKTNAFLKVSANQLRGELSSQLAHIREKLMNIYIEIEAIVNFPEDEIDAKGRDRLSKDIESTKELVNQLLSSADQGRLLKEGIKIVLCGKPNVGKSSLLNIFLKVERAIVSNIAGTTRDTIEETASINGYPFLFVDTAGILTPRDIIEEEAIRRSHLHIEGADLVLLLLDSSLPLEAADYDLIERFKVQNMIIVLNKSDLPQRISKEELNKVASGKSLQSISALKSKDIDSLKRLIIENVLKGKEASSQNLLVSNMRHITALKDGCQALDRAQEHLKNGLSLEFVSEEIKIAVNNLDGITGRNIDYDLLDNIFSQFCIGK